MIQYSLAAIAGIICGVFYEYFPVSITVLSLLLLLLLKTGPYKKGLSVILIVFSGAFLWSFYAKKAVNKLEAVEGLAYIKGTVNDVPERYQEKVRFPLSIEQINQKHVGGQVIAISSERLEVNAGDSIVALAKLKRVVPHCNSPVLYTQSWNKREKYYAFIKSLVVIGKGNSWRSDIDMIRQNLKNAIDNSLDHDAASFVQAIVLGLQKQIEPELRDAFIASGVAHILTISGTHFGLLALVVFVMVKRLTLFLPEKLLIRLTLYITPSQVSAISTFIVLTIYLAVSGWKIPSLRSFIMFAVYLLSIFLTRKNRALNALAFAALIIVLCQPEALFSLSFQLSFLAVLFIALGLQRFYVKQSKSFRITDKLKGMLLITLLAMAGTAPLIAMAFHQFSFISFIANLVIPSVVCFLILPLAFLSLLFVTLFNLSIMPFSSLIQALVKLVIWIVKLLSSFPLAAVPVASPSLVVILLYYVGLVLILTYSNKQRFLPMVIAMILYFVTPYFVDSQVSVTFLDVGQADSALVRLPDGRVLIVDGGEQQNDPQNGPFVSYLLDKGIKRIHFIALSHGHPDHFGGLLDVMDRFDVMEIWYNGRATSESEPFFKKVFEKSIPLRVLKRGDLIEGDGYQVLVFHPYDTFYSDGTVNVQENNESLVIMLRLYNTSILFTGDIETEAEFDLGHLGRWLDCDIIKVPHHGGRSSSLPYLLNEARPEVAIISVGKQNQFRHPHKETLLRYSSARVYRTDMDGAITVKIDEKGYKVETCKDKALRKVKSINDELRNLRVLIYQSIWKS